VPEEVKAYVRGCYGRTPAPMDEEVQRLILGDEEPIDCRPADLLEPGYEKAAAEIGDLAQSEEDVLSYGLFPQVARPFLERRAKGVAREETGPAMAAAVAAKEAQARRGIAPSAAPVSMWKLAGRIRRAGR
jgi:oxaloacetate decarboxylase alpha subunit